MAHGYLETIKAVEDGKDVDHYCFTDEHYFYRRTVVNHAGGYQLDGAIQNDCTVEVTNLADGTFYIVELTDAPDPIKNLAGAIAAVNRFINEFTND